VRSLRRDFAYLRWEKEVRLTWCENYGMDVRQADVGRIRKRKAESQDATNDRLSKRLSLLNLGS
jgi:hypothetical protein